MKFKFLVLIVAALLASAPVYAKGKIKDSSKPSSEQLVVKQACYIAGELGLDSKQTQKFIDAYTRCHQEVK